ncbi:MAG: hypothetical protein C0475_04100 [Planctomyces sp.]|nr:hypothetical protein [Planctomyces sp.]MBA4039094.1 hypothetical protein [Planctomyces sp.]MBA4120211.1 hypothetical protein [Isosphaera sp.]
MTEPIVLPPGRLPDLCGALAELGVRQLTLRTAAGVRTLAARQTDLPGLILALSPTDRIACDRPRVVIELAADGRVAVRTDHPPLMARLAAPAA